MKLQDIFLTAAQQAPDAPAVEEPDASLTYSEIDRWANRLGRALIARGVGPGDRVGIWMDKSAAAIATMQAILRVGAAYVPLDPVGPLQRSRTIITDCEMRAVVTTEERAESLGPDPGVELLLIDEGVGGSSELSEAALPPVDVGDRGLAYILYTSGSTGVPKGVCISHENALAFISWAASAVDAWADDRFSSHAPLHFDLSVFDIYVCAWAKATVVIISEGSAYLPKKLVQTMVERRISVWYSVPSALILMMDHGQMFERSVEHRPRVIVFAGEPFPIEPLRRLRDHFPDARLWNFYGPTETNVCTAYEVETLSPDVRALPIGTPASFDRCHVLRSDGERAGPGEEGELIVEGPTVMLGYWGKNPLGEQRYPTGDLVRVRDDGGYDYLGRRDHMVKVRGFRVELQEVEAVLTSHPAVRQAAVIVQGKGVNARLVAFLVTDNDTQPSLLELKRYSALRLPRYMLVDKATRVDELPRTRNGKLDRARLVQLAA